MDAPRIRTTLVPCLLLPLLLTGCLGGADLSQPAAAEAPTPALIGLVTVADALDRPVQFVPYPGQPDRFLVAEMGGTVRLVTPEGAQAAPVLDIAPRLATHHREQGLLGLALHPAFPDDPRLFVTYTHTDDAVHLSSFLMGPDMTSDPATEQVLLSVPQYKPYHNGGHIAFGPDGLLYAAFGDGSPQGDPDGNAQNRTNLLGTIIRIDVNATTGYHIPSDNPFVDRPGRDEIWLYGLRNPWRFSFDHATGDLWIGDVGYNGHEEINHVPAAYGGGHNLGWPRWEGSEPFDPDRHAEGTFVFPVHEYGRQGTCSSVTGGHVYRGQALPTLVGRYVYADFCSGSIQALAHGDDLWQARELLPSGLLVTGFGEGHDGELHVLSYSGSIMRIVPPRPAS